MIAATPKKYSRPSAATIITCLPFFTFNVMILSGLFGVFQRTRSHPRTLWKTCSAREQISAIQSKGSELILSLSLLHVDYKHNACKHNDKSAANSKENSTDSACCGKLLALNVEYFECSISNWLIIRIVVKIGAKVCKCVCACKLIAEVNCCNCKYYIVSLLVVS